MRGLKFHSDGHINFVVGVDGEPCNLGTGPKVTSLASRHEKGVPWG